MVKSIILALVALSTASVHAANWVAISSTISVDAESVRANSEGAMMISKRIDTSGTTRFEHVLVTKEACSDGYGTLFIFRLNKFDDEPFETDWARGGDTVSSQIAEYLCGFVARKHTPGNRF